MKISKFLIAGLFTLASFGAQALTLSVLDSTGGWDAIDVDNTGVVKEVDLAKSLTDGGDWVGTVLVGVEPVSVPGNLQGMFFEFGGAPSATLEISVGGISLGVFNANIDGNLPIALANPSTLIEYKVTGTEGQFWTLGSEITAVPIPAAAWLFGSGLIGLAGIARRKKATA